MTGGRAAIKQAQEDNWLAENQAAIAAHVQRVAQSGPLLVPDWADDDGVLSPVAQRALFCYKPRMEIRNIRHKGLRNLIEKDNPKGLAPQYIPKIRAIMAFLIDMEGVEEIYNLQKFKPHLLGGDRAGTYSLSVTPNWRITFQYDDKTDELFDVDYEDYH